MPEVGLEPPIARERLLEIDTRSNDPPNTAGFSFKIIIFDNFTILFIAR